jgi:hypothetical protein
MRESPPQGPAHRIAHLPHVHDEDGKVPEQKKKNGGNSVPDETVTLFQCIHLTLVYLLTLLLSFSEFFFQLANVIDTISKRWQSKSLQYFTFPHLSLADSYSIPF